MKLEETKELALELMKQHNLINTGWKFEYDNAKLRFGSCSHNKKIISLSKHLTLIREYSNIKNTILHEIAHALVGKGHGHNEVWRAKAIEIGCNGNRCSNDARLEGAYIGNCPNGHIHYRHKKPKENKLTSCGYCNPKTFDDRYIIKYKKNI